MRATQPMHLRRRNLNLQSILPLCLLVLSLVWLAGCENPLDQVQGEPQVEVVTTGADADVDAGAGENPTASSGQAATLLPTPTPTPEPLKGRIVLWHSWAEADGDALAEILADFQRANPEVTVDTLFVAYPDLAQSYADAVAGGSGPDLLLAPTWWLGDLVNAGVVAPLDDLISPADLARFAPAAVDSLRRDGQLFGLPVSFELVSLFVNRSLADPMAAPATTEALLAQAQQAPALGVGLYNNLYHLYWGIPAYGGQLFNDSGAVVLDQGGDTAGYLSWLRALSQTPGSYVDTDYGMLLDRFKKGEFAYFVDGPWSIGELRAALGDSLAVVPLPAGPAGPASPWLQAEGLFLNPRLPEEQRALALAFAGHLTSAESGATLAKIADRLSANRNVAITDNPILAGFMAQADTAQPLPGLSEMDEVWGYGGDMITKVVDGDADPVTTVAETAALLNDVNGK